MDELYQNDFTPPPPTKKRWPLVVGVSVLLLVVIALLSFWLHGRTSSTHSSIPAAISTQTKQQVASACNKASSFSTCQFNVITGTAAKTDNPAACQTLTGEWVDKCLFMVALTASDKKACAAVGDKTLLAACTRVLQSAALAKTPATKTN